MRNLINRLLVKLGLREPPSFRELYKGPIHIPEGPSLTDEEMAKFDTIGWKFYNSYGIIGTGTVRVERSEEHEQTNT